MSLLIKPLMQKSKLASRLYSEQERWIFDTFEVNGQPRKMIRTLRTLKKISLLRILLLIRHHHQVGPYPHWHSQLKRTRIIVFAREDPVNKAKARAKIFLPPTSMPPLSGRIKTKTRRT